MDFTIGTACSNMQFGLMLTAHFVSDKFSDTWQINDNMQKQTKNSIQCQINDAAPAETF